MALLMPQGKHQYFTTAGEPLVGGKVYTYAAGTSTLLTTYSAQSGAPGTENANPVVLDARGEATIFFGAAGYKVVLRDALDNIIWTQDNLFPNSVLETFTITDDLTFTGTGNRILGDFSNATQAYRVMFQTSTANGATQVEAIPNGTSDIASFIVSNSSSDPGNSSIVNILVTETEARLQSTKRGTGTYLPLQFNTNDIKQAEIPVTGGFQVVQPALLGYGTGAGGTVTQTTDKNTAVTINAPSGQITMHAANMVAGEVAAFVVNNTSTHLGAIIPINIMGGVTSAADYNVWVSTGSSNSFTVFVKNISTGTLSNPIILSFAILNGATT
jgi:hypothetical protein